MIVLEYEIKRDEVVDYHNNQSTNAGSYKGITLLLQLGGPVLGLIVIFILLMLFSSLKNISFLLALPAIVVLSIIWIILVPKVALDVYNTGSNQILTGIHLTEFKAEGIFDQYYKKTINTPWQAVNGVRVTDKYVLIYSEKAIKYLIPRRIFAEGQFELFMGAVKRYYQGPIE